VIGRAVILASGAALLLLGGCTSQFKRIETNTDQAVQNQQRLEQQLAALTADIEAIRDGESAREADYLALRAEMEHQLRQLDTVVRQMDVRSAEQEALLREVLAALDLLARQPVVGATDSLAGPADAAALGGSPGKDVFDAAWADYTRGDYAFARDGFQEVVDRFGRSELADDAAYWVAETWYAQRDYEQARDGFERMLDDYPDSDVRPAAMLKLGYSLIETGEPDRAITVLEELQSTHPESDEALIAGHKLSTLTGDGGSR
jgi:tol-pal system protein YbgF